ncbi:MAG: RiPP maturation radical SAM C-methyltransferase [Oligoflexales bacterium]|nr:RiPP maturation radical SAM C-methyltransferase [Oligoflexales bacterium]
MRNLLKENMSYLNEILSKDVDIAFIVPPFTLLQSPNLGLHNLQLISEQSGYRVQIIYLDMLFAKFIGFDIYRHIANQLMSPYLQIGERIFSSSGFDLPLLGNNADKIIGYLETGEIKMDKEELFSMLKEIAKKAIDWSDQVADIMAKMNYKIIGLSSGHQQTSASISLIKRIKKISPETITVIGGSNCDGEMSGGMTSLCDEIDYVFTGESEFSWSDFLDKLKSNVLPKKKIIKASNTVPIDKISLPNFDNFFTQAQILLDEHSLNSLWMLYESSRGCWWRVAKGCSFCGIDGTNIEYRYKSASKVLNELNQITMKYPTRRIRIVDTLMPREYFKSLLPKFDNVLAENSYFYEQRADLTLDQMLILKNSGIDFLQIGIESLNTSLLDRLNKGISAEQNIKILRFAQMSACVIGWNLLCEIPGDRDEEWESVLDLLPLIRHLTPPKYLRPVEVVRFSHYFNKPKLYDITDMTHFEVYNDIFPSYSDRKNLSWLFTAKYESASRKNKLLMKQVLEEVEKWKELWLGSDEKHPVLEIMKINDHYVLLDTRCIEGTTDVQIISKSQAKAALFGIGDELALRWAINSKVIVEIDSSFVPLAVCNIQEYRALASAEETKL